jgi:hypothetical protein
MTFTYVGDLSTDLDKVRFYVQDTAEGSGPKPSGVNFTDEEIGGLVTAEGSWQRSVAACFDALASIWGRYADITAGPHRESLSQIAEGFRKRAEAWRKEHGSTSRASISAMTRVDGYSDDVASNEVD